MRSRNFFILSLGRARSRWFSVYFTNDKSICYHEPAAHLGKDLIEEFRKDDGIARGGAGADLAAMYPTLKWHFPEGVFLKIVRPFEDVLASYRRRFGRFNEEFLHLLAQDFDQIPEQQIDYDDVDARIEEIEALVGVTVPKHKRDLMLNTVAEVKDVRY